MLGGGVEEAVDEERRWVEMWAVGVGEGGKRRLGR